MIKIENLGFKYKNKDKVLENIDLNINEGEIIGIIGKNGSGKSTLARLISGITKPNDGNIFIDEINTKDKEKFKELRKIIRYCFSKPRKSDNI